MLSVSLFYFQVFMDLQIAWSFLYLLFTIDKIDSNPVSTNSKAYESSPFGNGRSLPVNCFAVTSEEYGSIIISYLIFSISEPVPILDVVVTIMDAYFFAFSFCNFVCFE